MSRYRSFYPLDEAKKDDGDDFFLGVNMLDDPASLPAGVAQDAQNKRFTKRKAACRDGVIKPTFANLISYGTIYGSGVFSDPTTDGTEWLMLAVSDGVYLTRYGRYPTKIDLDSGLSITGTVDFVQCFNVVVMFRGEDLTPLVWDGDFFTNFTEITQTGSGGTNAIPNAVTGLLFSDRLLVKASKDEVAASDLGNYTRYVAVLQQFRINYGSDDALTRFHPYTDGVVILFKDQSCFFATGATGDLADLTLNELSREKGSIATYGALSLGDEVWFLSDDGIYRIMPFSQQQRLKVDPNPVSRPIQPLIDRINWTYAGGAVAERWKENAFFAVPIDGSTYNNAILVFNTTTGYWDGIDTWNSSIGFRVDRFHVTDYMGVKRLFAVDRGNARVILMYEGDSDFIGTEYQISDYVHTRRYRAQDPSIKQHDTCEVAVETRNPSMTFEAFTEGVSESTTLATSMTKDRTKYYLHGVADFTLTNANGDFSNRGRKDYHVESGDSILSNSSWNPTLKQDSLERFPIRARGRGCSIKISNAQGRCDVVSVGFGGRTAQRSIKQGA